MICCVPGEDRTNGFFVSCFVRKGSSAGKKRSHGEVAANDGEDVATKRPKLDVQTSDREEGDDEDAGNDAPANVDAQAPSSSKKKKNKKKKKKAKALTS